MVADILQITGTDARAAARLCNYVTAQSFLLPAHTAWLDNMVKPIVTQDPNHWVDIIGYASHLGPAAFNQKLSDDRCTSVKKQIESYGVPVRFKINWGKGESESTGDADNNDGYWRATDVYVYRPGSEPPPPPIPPPPAAVPGSKKFRIRVFEASGVSVGIGQVDFVVFHIVDDENTRCGQYFFLGAGLAVSIAKIKTPPASISGAGIFTNFTSTRKILLTSFVGPAEFFQSPGASIGPKSFGGQCFIGPQSPPAGREAGIEQNRALSPGHSGRDRQWLRCRVRISISRQTERPDHPRDR